MKTSLKTISLLASAALFTLNSLSAVETDPVGYVTETLSPATFNLIGFNLSAPVVAAGEFESSSATTLTDSQGDFINSLSEDGDYFVKITSGTGTVGLNTDVVALSATELTTSDDLSSAVVAGTSYEIRKVLTVGDIFGANNEAELKGALAGDRSNADIIWIPDGVGGFTQVYYNATPRTGFGALTVGWKTTASGDSDATNEPIYFTSGVFIEVKRSAFEPSEEGFVDVDTKNLIVSGSVQVENTQVILETGFNFVSRVFPGGVTLGESGLESQIQGALAGDRTNADIIWVPDGSGGYTQYYYNATPRTGFGALSVGWKGTATGDSDASGAELASGVIIERKNAPIMLTLAIPEAVANNL